MAAEHPAPAEWDPVADPLTVCGDEDCPRWGHHVYDPTDGCPAPAAAVAEAGLSEDEGCRTACKPGGVCRWVGCQRDTLGGFLIAGGDVEAYGRTDALVAVVEGIVQAATERAVAAERTRIAEAVNDLPATRTQTWTTGRNSVALTDVLDAIHPGSDT